MSFTLMLVKNDVFFLTEIALAVIYGNRRLFPVA